MNLALLLAATLAAAPPTLGPAEAQAKLGRNLSEARVRNIRGVLRIRLLGLLRLVDAAGPYLLGRFELRNARSQEAELRPSNLALRGLDGTWFEALGLADRPPLSGFPIRPSLVSAGPVRVPRDGSLVIYAAFRTTLDPAEVDAVARFDGHPFFLRRPLQAGPGELAAEALALLQQGRRAEADGLLEEAVRDNEAARLALGELLLAAARKLRVADQPVAEDRVLRLALPYAPNPAFVQARLGELRRPPRTRLPQETYRPARRDWAYHQRRSERYRVVEEEPRPPTTSGRPR